MKRVKIPELEFRFPTEPLTPHYEDGITVLRIPEGTEKAEREVAEKLRSLMAKGKSTKKPAYRTTWRRR